MGCSLAYALGDKNGRIRGMMAGSLEHNTMQLKQETYFE
jgi:hypothetical protein